MLKETHHQIRRELEREGAFGVLNLYGALTVLCELTFLAVGLFLLLRVQPFSIPYWVLQVLFGVAIFRASSLVHECAHSSMFSSRGLNTIFGLLFSPICLIPYVPYQNVHLAHHKWVGVVDKDPTQIVVLTMTELSGVKKTLMGIIWRGWIPLPFMAFVIKTYWLYALREFRKGHTSTGWKAVGSMAFAVVPHVLAIVFLGALKYLTIYGPMFVLFYLQFENMYIPQHSKLFPYVSQLRRKPIPYYEQDTITRSTYLPRFLSVVLGYYHNLHTEHHLFPTVPWYRLPLVKRKLAAAGDVDYKEVNFLRFMGAAREHNPVDSYVASLPKRGKVETESL
jgi:omega-6 fatty acid desaturase (delta-12 desaturase)